MLRFWLILDIDVYNLRLFDHEDPSYILQSPPVTPSLSFVPIDPEIEVFYSK